MKKILAAILCLVSYSAFADCKSALGVNFTSNQKNSLCSTFGTSVQGSLIPGANNTYDLGSASLTWRSLYLGTSAVVPLLSPTSSLVIRADQDAQRNFTFDASSDTALTLTFGDGGTTAAQALSITGSTSDADDDSLLCITGAGTCGAPTRGAFVATYGNEYATTPGQVSITAGTVAGADVVSVTNDDFFFNNAGGTNLLIVTDAGKSILNGELGNQATSFGCTAVAGANTACTTTCTTGCMFGQDSGGANKAVLACDDATADLCICCN